MGACWCKCSGPKEIKDSRDEAFWRVAQKPWLSTQVPFHHGAHLRKSTAGQMGKLLDTAFTTTHCHGHSYHPHHVKLLDPLRLPVYPMNTRTSRYIRMQSLHIPQQHVTQNMTRFDPDAARSWIWCHSEAKVHSQVDPQVQNQTQVWPSRNLDHFMVCQDQMDRFNMLRVWEPWQYMRGSEGYCRYILYRSDLCTSDCVQLGLVRVVKPFWTSLDSTREASWLDCCWVHNVLRKVHGHVLSKWAIVLDTCSISSICTPFINYDQKDLIGILSQDWFMRNENVLSSCNLRRRLGS